MLYKYPLMKINNFHHHLLFIVISNNSSPYFILNQYFIVFNNNLIYSLILGGKFNCLIYNFYKSISKTDLH